MSIRHHINDGFLLCFYHHAISCCWKVLKRLVIDPNAHLDPKPTLTLVPQASLAEFWLPLTAFHLGEDAKNGCSGLNLCDIFGILCGVFCQKQFVQSPYHLNLPTTPSPCRLAAERAVSPTLWGVSPWLQVVGGVCGNQISICRFNQADQRLQRLFQRWVYKSAAHDQHLLFHS